VIKGGIFLEHGTFSLDSKKSWKDVIATDTSSEAMNLIIEHYPRDYVLNKEKIEYFISSHFKPQCPTYIPNPAHIFNINPYPELQQFIEQRLEVRILPRSRSSKEEGAINSQHLRLYPASRRIDASYPMLTKQFNL
jgi:hypothetical protein